ncbi:adenosylcobinamide amidohydrolase [Methanoregula sp.]|uniref:adenosylcobinamide amidohydrolase n=1 Tax=Methanoregula sp. TaxID=2052170 RepID=UPI00236AA913|nr:adenosylcobinamide amidohydrolase [Methanoregula sp.]MDD1687384.1 adenosylcobinamide amidohydrolase [Methanoregula sp.]
MRYYSDKNTLFICGSFRAASTGLFGGIRSVSTLFNHTVPQGWDHNNPEKELERVAAEAGIGPDTFGLLTAVPVEQACVLQYDFITVFITAGIRREPPATAGTINIMVTSSEGMEDAALLETIMVATEAKAEALLALDLPATGTPTDAVIAACEGELKHRYAGRITEAGLRVREAVLRGIPEALRRHDAGGIPDHPAFFIYSRFKGGHWVHWTPGAECPYYPCHFKGQACDFCYCPFYPCKDESLGQWIESSGGGKVWNCAACTLLHEPDVAAYYKKFPQASREEMVQFARKIVK